MLHALLLAVAMLPVAWLTVAAVAYVGRAITPPARSLAEDYGVRTGRIAPQLAALRDDQQFHLDFADQLTFLVFGLPGCAPCSELLEIAPVHPALRYARLVYVAGASDTDDGVPLDRLARWERYEFDNEELARRNFNAPASPFFHLIGGEDGRVLAKGIANAPAHLDRLVGALPPRTRLAP